MSAATAGTTLKIGSREISVSNPNKVLYRDAKFTKKDVIEYYVRISDVMLPHIKGRAVTLKRYPNGSEDMFFYEKNCPVHRPPWVTTANVPSANRTGGINYCLIDNKASLAWLAQIASL